MAAEQEKLRFDGEREERARFLIALRRAVEQTARGMNATTKRCVLDFGLWVYNVTTKNDTRRPTLFECDYESIADEFFGMGRSTIGKVVNTAIATGIVTAADHKSGRAAYQFSIDIEAVAGWLKRAGHTSKCAPQTSKFARQTTIEEDPLFDSFENDVVDRSMADGAVFSEGEVADVRALANDVIERCAIRRPSSAADRRLVLTVCVLVVRGELPRDAVEQAVEATKIKRPDNPAAWLKTCVVNQCRRLWIDFHALELTTPLPAELLSKRKESSDAGA